MSDIEQLQLIRSQTFQQLVDLRAHPKPSYYIDGQQVSWDTYIARLEHTIDWCDRKLNEYQPYEIRSEGSS